jgi:ElaB/YqjD/DUF883 family membrane-anchored ribosome-binding protein
MIEKATATASNGLPESGPDPDQLHAAAEEVRHAEAELQRLRENYAELLRQATRQVEVASGTSLGDILDGTERIVKKHPLSSVVFAGLIGIFLGRLFHR